MTKREFANHVAGLVGGKVVEVEKANGVIFIGIQSTEYDNGDGNMIAPMVYIDDLWSRGLSIDETVAYVFNAFDNAGTFEINFVKQFDLVKDKIRVAMLNKASNVPCSISAKKFGFDDLIVYPYVRLSTENNQQASVKVTPQLLEMWKVDLDTVINIGFENMNDETEVMPFVEKLISMGMPRIMAEDLPMKDWFIVSNTNMTFGAANVITQKAKDLLPTDYIVIPSSIHEVIVAPYTDEMEDSIYDLVGIIGQVNETEVSPEEVLGHKPYLFIS